MKNLLKLKDVFHSTLKFDLKMKLLLNFYLISLFQIHAGPLSLKEPISISFDKVALEVVLHEIENLTDYKILYNDNEVDYRRIISINYTNTPLSEVLDGIFKNTAITYETMNNQIVLNRKQAFLKAGFNKKPPINLQRSITGIVTDKQGVPMPGVNVIIEGTSIGTTTDFEGEYTLDLSNSDTQAVVVFTYVGMKTIKKTVGQNATISVQMEEDAQSLDAVVITALGIEKEVRKLGYAVSEVDAEEVTVNRTSNFMNSLQGKVAGVNISALGSGPGGSSKVRIRGQSSISGNNSPLIVVNGVPIDNTSFGTNPGSAGNEPGTSDGGVYSDGGDGFSSINPDDIESMTVLKGATAAALYGSRAKDGVIMITTKTRGSGQGIGVTYNLNVTNHTPLDYTDYQYEYGQGENGVRPTEANPTSGQWSFGEKFAPGMTQVLFDGVVVPYEPVHDRIKKFYRMGLDVTNSVSVSGGRENGGFNLSLANLKSEGITPNNEFERKTVSLGVTQDLTSKLNVNVHLNYSNEENSNPPNVGQQDNTIPVSLYNMANSMPFDLLNQYKFDENGNEYVYSRFRNRTNPYFTLSEQFNQIKRDRIFGNIAAKYNVLPWLFIQGRIGQDYWSRDQQYNGFPTGQASRGPAPQGFVNGTFTQDVRKFRETNLDVLLSASKDFGENFNLGVNLGGNRMHRRSDANRVDVTDFVIRDLYTVQNGRVKDPTYSLSERAVNSVYGAVDLSFNDTYYLSGTFRNDWFSTLSPENRSILYPSVSGSYVFSNDLAEESNWLSFGKLRFAYAEVGSDTDVPPYSNALFYNIDPNFFANSDGVLQPIAGAASSTLPNPFLKPMRTTEMEVGLDLRLFDNRIAFDVAVYRKLTKDQIIPAQISNTSGFVNTLINSGESRSDGFELMVNLVPFRSDDFTWELNLNTSYNKTKVLSLLTDQPGDRILVGEHIFNGFLYQVVGEEIGQLAGFGYRRDDQGRKIYGNDGRALPSEDIKLYGSALPRWIGGFTNTIHYKDFNFSFLIDFKLGNKMISGTNFNAVRHGLHKMTVPGREMGVIGDGVNLAGQVNTVAAESQQYWEVVRASQIIEPIVYNGGFWKLRQITFGYNFQKFIPEDSFFKGATLSLVANNVLILKKWVDNIDPDSFAFSSDNVSGLESTGLPTTRSIGFNLNCKF